MKYINLRALALLVSFGSGAPAHELTEAELTEYALTTRAGMFGAIKQQCQLADSENLSIDVLEYNICVHESLVMAIVGGGMADWNDLSPELGPV